MIWIEVRQRHQREDFAAPDIQDNPCCADCRELGYGTAKFVMHDVLHAHVEGNSNRTATYSKSIVERSFDTGESFVIDVGVTKNVSG